MQCLRTLCIFIAFHDPVFYHRIIFLIQGAGVLYQALDYGYESDNKTLIVQAVGELSTLWAQAHLSSLTCEALYCHSTLKSISGSYDSMVIDDLHCRVLVDSRMVGWMCLAVLFPMADSSGHVDLHAVPTCWLQQLCHCPQQSLQVTLTFKMCNFLDGVPKLKAACMERPRALPCK